MSAAPRLRWAVQERTLGAVEDLDRARVRYAAWYIDQARTTTAARRFVRDVAERRKPVPFLVQRGWSLYRTDAARRAAAVAVGFTPRRKREIIADLTA